MSTATQTPEGHAPEHGHDHPSDASYVKVAIILGLITALEVGTYFWEDLFGSQPSTAALLLTLMPMMVIKFFVVCGWFMHLRYDIPLFRRIFVFGLILALIVYAIMAFTFEYFSEDYLKFLRREG
jgi:cytochrome c oxidase subunit IV